LGYRALLMDGGLYTRSSISCKDEEKKMVNGKIFRGIAGVTALFAVVAAHAQVATQDTGKPVKTVELESGHPSDPARDGTSPVTTRDTSSNTTQAIPSPTGMQVATGQQKELQQGALQSSTRQSGVQQTGMNGATRQGATQVGATQAGATQSGAAQVVRDREAPPTIERSREAQDARAGVTPETMTGRSGTQGTAAAGAGTLNRADRKAIMDMAMANMAEVEMGKMAQAKGSSEEVKTFGQQMIDDHGKALEEVQALAQAKGVTLPSDLDAKHRKEADKLNAMSGAAFDKAYMDRAGVRDHRKVNGDLANIQASARDADVKALAAKMKPVVQQHLNSAQQISKKK
jgi:predicted outer membrane protein